MDDLEPLAEGEQRIVAIDEAEQRALFNTSMDRLSWTLIVFTGTLAALMAVLSFVCVVLIYLFATSSLMDEDL